MTLVMMTTYNINKCDITYMFLITVIGIVIDKQNQLYVKSFISKTSCSVIINNVTCI
jgi:hypothetical protein